MTFARKYFICNICVPPIVAMLIIGQVKEKTYAKTNNLSNQNPNANPALKTKTGNN